MDFRHRLGRERYDALVAGAARTVVGLDFDGVLSPIVPDPADARIHPDGPATLVEVGRQVRGVAVITGRPAAQAVELGDLESVGRELASTGQVLHVLGQYGNQRWSSADNEVVSPPAPEGLADLVAELPGMLEGLGLGDAYVEDKGLAVAVHTRRLPEPVAAFERLLPVLTEAAHRHDLGVEPGRMVVEVRAAGMHKGEAVLAIHTELDGDGVMFAGDDLGDVEAFRAVERLRDQGHPGLLVCSGSEEQRALVEMSDLVVDGPDGVLAMLRSFAQAAVG